MGHESLLPVVEGPASSAVRLPRHPACAPLRPDPSRMCEAATPGHRGLEWLEESGLSHEGLRALQRHETHCFAPGAPPAQLTSAHTR